MQIVIDIDESTYEQIKVLNTMFQGVEKVFNAIKDGILLPKGHGKIVDIGKIDEDRIDRDNPIIYLTVNGDYTEAISLDYLNKLDAIAEADTD